MVAQVLGIDISPDRIHAIRTGQVDLAGAQHAALTGALRADGFRLTTAPAAVRHADAVVVCVPTPIDQHRLPDLGPLRAACASVVRHARAGCSACPIAPSRSPTS